MNNNQLSILVAACLAICFTGWSVFFIFKRFKKVFTDIFQENKNIRIIKFFFLMAISYLFNRIQEDKQFIEEYLDNDQKKSDFQELKDWI